MMGDPVNKPIVVSTISKTGEYAIKEIIGGYMTEAVQYIETECIGKCRHPHRIDERHPEYKRVKEALDHGDRSLIFCYHKPLTR